MESYEVTCQLGLDAFGMSAENATCYADYTG
jgi:hypothetical protein